MQAVDLDNTHYDTLGVNRKARGDDIKAAYRRLTRANHPDLGGDAATFAAINVAYEVLRDDRDDYDASLAAAERRSTGPVEVPDDWEPEEWLEAEVVDDRGNWVEEVVAPGGPAYQPHPPPFVDVTPIRPPIRIPRPRPAPAPTYHAAVVGRFSSPDAKRAIAAFVLVFASFAVSYFGAAPAGVVWVVYVSFPVCVLSFLRTWALEWFGLAGSLVLSALIIWGAYADDETIGALAAFGVLAPIIVAGELLAVAARYREKTTGRFWKTPTR